ncbi:MAG: malto-oligosyltrehalose synthase, partial [Bacteroidetes bacterium]
MYNPIATYRIQFNKDYTLKDLEKQIEYLSLLGIGAVYASPVFAATPGSAHGYDVIDPLRFNPEVTDEDTFGKVRKKMLQKNMGWIQDIVPNHMAYHPGNAWMMDILEKGSDSAYYRFFDLEPGVAGKDNKLMVPFLGVMPDEAIKNGDIKTGWKNGTFTVAYFDNIYPVNHETFRSIAKSNISAAPASIKELWDKQLKATVTKTYLQKEWEEAKKKAQQLYAENPEVKEFIDNLTQKLSSSEESIREILEMQFFELCHWQETEKRINFRRFFTVNGLICLRMEEPEVFEMFHSFLMQQAEQGNISGLRIDHIDGLNDPNNYLENLRKICGEETWIVAEKILEHHEELPSFWPVQGSTGYDFLAMVNNLLTSVEHYDKLKTLYREVTNIKASPAELVYKNKKMILTTRMHGEWDNIFQYFNQFGFIDYEKENVSREEIKEALGEFMLACPVYRLYPRGFPLRNQNRKVVEEIFATAQKRTPALTLALGKLSSILLLQKHDDNVFNKKLQLFFSRLMQFTGPLMAKGVEDTSMYQYNCFIAHNEVGDAINAAGITISEFHAAMEDRQQKWPYTMNTTSTHDTKRGEDVRARLNIVSELTDEWKEKVHQWMQMNQKLKIRLDTGLLEPSTSIEYFIYQTLLGTFPFDGQIDETYLQRIDEYLVKALREAKRKVSWRDPDDTYENTVCQFARQVLNPKHDFLAAFVPFMQKVAWRGITNSLTQLTLKTTCPGIPDIYQGTELWDFTLVDPDNRQPVDYQLRLAQLKEMKSHQQPDNDVLLRDLLKNATDGRIKLWYTACLLNARKQNPDLFVKGEYIALTVSGKRKAHMLAFARKHQDDWAIVAVPLITATLSDQTGAACLLDMDWGDTRIQLPPNAPEKWLNAITSKTIRGKEILVPEEVFTGIA